MTEIVTPAPAPLAPPAAPTAPAPPPPGLYPLPLPPLPCRRRLLQARGLAPALPPPDGSVGVAMDDSGAVTYLAAPTFGDQFHATLVRIVDGEVAWSVTHDPKFSYVRPYGLATRGDGVTMLVGFSDDSHADTSGDVPWAAVYDATGAMLLDQVDETVMDPNACFGSPCVLGYNRAAVVNDAGEFLVAGVKDLRFDADIHWDSYGVLRRFDATGELAVTPFLMSMDLGGVNEVRSLAQRGDGSLVMFGERDADYPATDWWFARLDADGGFGDLTTLSAGETDEAGGVVYRDDGTIVFSAQSGDWPDEQAFVASLDADLAPGWQRKGSLFGPIVLGDDDATFQVLDGDRVATKLSAAGEPLWQDSCMEGDPADALALSPDRTRLIVCRTLDADRVVEIYENI